MKKRIVAVLTLIMAVFCVVGIAACGKEKAPLPTPELFRIVNGNLFWEPVENANGYTLDINGEIHEVQDTFYLFTDYEYNVPYLFRLKANGGSHYADSEWVELTYTYEEAGTLGLSYKLSEDGSYYSVSGSKKLSGRVVIPLHNNNLPVRAIAVGAFQNCTEITEIVIPNTVTTIGNFAFHGCTQLDAFNIPDSVVSIGYYAFKDTPWFENHSDGLVYAGKVLYTYKGEMAENTAITNVRAGTLAVATEAFYLQRNLTEIVLPDSVLYIGDNAFRAASISEIALPAGLLTIGASAFQGTDLVHVKIPDGVTELAREVFAGCENLESVELPASLQNIGYRAFWQCDRLTSIEIPEGTLTIGDQVFRNCDNFTSLTLPASLKSIGKEACFGCSLTEIHYAGTQSQWRTIEKGENWDTYYYAVIGQGSGYYRDAYSVFCSNGIIEVEEGWASKNPGLWS